MKSLLRAVYISGLLLAVPSLAFAAPGIPHQFYGNATYTNGTAISSGNVIVKIGTTQVASVPISNGKYGYNPNLLMVTDPDSNRVGSTLKFFIDSVDTGTTAVFAKGGYTNLNLDTLVAPTPTPSSGGTPPPTLDVIPPAVTNLTEAQKVYDTNGDDSIDVLDFNALIVHWGETGSAVIADFDGNGTVDVFDFNALMVHWTA